LSQAQLNRRSASFAHKAAAALGIAVLACMPMMATAKRDVERGEYLTTILGCGGCHTEGALLGNPTGDWLTGSTIGVAYTNEGADETPGIIFPANLTPDRATGIGRWSKRDLIRFLRTGMDHYGEQANSVMPWPNYALLKDRDLAAVADYLLSLTPVQNEIPNAIEAGQPINESFVRIGVYLFVPESQTQLQEQSDE